MHFFTHKSLMISERCRMAAWWFSQSPTRSRSQFALSIGKHRQESPHARRPSSRPCAFEEQGLKTFSQTLLARGSMWKILRTQQQPVCRLRNCSTFLPRTQPVEGLQAWCSMSTGPWNSNAQLVSASLQLKLWLRLPSSQPCAMLCNNPCTCRHLVHRQGGGGLMGMFQPTQSAATPAQMRVGCALDESQGSAHQTSTIRGSQGHRPPAHAADGTWQPSGRRTMMLSQHC